MSKIFEIQSLDLMRKAQDPLADEVISVYFPDRKAQLNELLAGIKTNAFEMDKEADQSLVRLVNDIQEHRENIDSRELAVGQKLFDKYASDCMLLLGFLSLPYCYAAANGAEVLVRSERIINEPEKRLSETAQFVFDVMAKDAFTDEGKGAVSILKVRLMHAAVRWYIIRSNTWNPTAFGLPVNQEDMAGTNLSFSLMVIRGLRRLGRKVNAQEALGYIQYWNTIGRMLGLDEQLLPQNNKEAFLLEKRIRKRHFKKSEAGIKLTKSLFSYFHEVSEGSPIEGKVNPFAHFLLGEEVCAMLDIRVPDSEKIAFKPYQLFLQFGNQVINKADTYAQAYLNYKKQIENIQINKDYAL